jgi:hypothetical protein
VAAGPLVAELDSDALGWMGLADDAVDTGVDADGRLVGGSAPLEAEESESGSEGSPQASSKRPMQAERSGVGKGDILVLTSVKRFNDDRPDGVEAGRRYLAFQFSD